MADEKKDDKAKQATPAAQPQAASGRLPDQLNIIEPAESEVDERMINIIMEQIKELIEIDNNLNNKIKSVETKTDANVQVLHKTEKLVDTFEGRLKTIEKNMQKFMGLYEFVTNQFNPFVSPGGAMPVNPDAELPMGIELPKSPPAQTIVLPSSPPPMQAPAPITQPAEPPKAAMAAPSPVTAPIQTAAQAQSTSDSGKSFGAGRIDLAAIKAKKAAEAASSSPATVQSPASTTPTVAPKPIINVGNTGLSGGVVQINQVKPVSASLYGNPFNPVGNSFIGSAILIEETLEKSGLGKAINEESINIIKAADIPKPQVAQDENEADEEEAIQIKQFTPAKVTPPSQITTTQQVSPQTPENKYDQAMDKLVEMFDGKMDAMLEERMKTMIQQEDNTEARIQKMMEKFSMMQPSSPKSFTPQIVEAIPETNKQTLKLEFEQIYKDVHPDHTFTMADGTQFTNLGQMMALLNQIDDSIFSLHVNSQRNDFAEWIEIAHGNVSLANAVRNIRNKTELVSLLWKFI